MNRITAAVLLALMLGGAERGEGQAVPMERPFSVGETLVYKARIGRVAGGTGEMRVEGPSPVRGRNAHVLRFDFRGGVGPIVMQGQTTSWIDMESMAALRFYKRERSPLGSSTESVDLFPAQRTWRAQDGREGEMPTPLPLDELSFLYFIRTLPLADGSSHTLDRHFDLRRNPVTIYVAGRKRIRVPAGEFAVVIVEMRVPAGKHVSNGGLIRVFLTDDAQRVPVRIESSVRIVGQVVLSLASCSREHPDGVRRP